MQPMEGTHHCSDLSLTRDPARVSLAPSARAACSRAADANQGVHGGTERCRSWAGPAGRGASLLSAAAQAAGNLPAPSPPASSPPGSGCVCVALGTFGARPVSVQLATRIAQI